jgi:hypothetical protein
MNARNTEVSVYEYIQIMFIIACSRNSLDLVRNAHAHTVFKLIK